VRREQEEVKINQREERTMAKAYWVVCYHSIKNQDAFQAYAKLAAPAVQAAGGRYLVRGSPAKVYEQGLNQRVVVIEFESLQKALAAHDGAGYQEALKALSGDAVKRDMRIVEGVG
jgi:uncharacterized protein (DUF1330 family)